MSPKSLYIKVDPLTRPRIPLVVAFPGEVVEFTVEGGTALVHIPGGDQYFDGLSGNELSLDPEKGPGTLMVKTGVIPEGLPQGALVVKYSVHCRAEDGETYFAEGDSAPKIIIPKFP
jgi:hypothetical protein